MYHIQTVSPLLGAALAYGDVYRTLKGAKVGLSRMVRLSREAARKGGYGRVYSHWGTERTLCQLTHGRDINSSLWETLTISTCRLGIPVWGKILDGEE